MVWESRWSRTQNGPVNLGRCYYDGEGVTKDYAEAVKWFRKSAEQDYAHAQNALGACYMEGEGVARDEAEGVKWFRLAAEQGEENAQSNLGTCYRDGKVVARDFVQAYRWLSLASIQGHAHATAAKSSLAQLMTPAQIAEGSQLARDFKPVRR